MEVIGKLQPSDSILILDCSSGTKRYNSVMNKKAYLGRSKGWSLISRAVEENGLTGLRVWRIT
jgi:hypothetical protein